MRLAIFWRRNSIESPKKPQRMLVVPFMSRAIITTSISLCIAAVGAAAYAWSKKKQMPPKAPHSTITPPKYAWDTLEINDDKATPTKIKLPPRKRLIPVTKNGNDVNLEFLASMTFANSGGMLRPPSCFCCR
jgi:hypothetical protein